MAKGGTGDVLAGMIAALLGQKFPVRDAVLAAVYLHGLAATSVRRHGGIFRHRLRHFRALPEAFKNVTEQ
jgi:NAD(P)H-hydrate epimerase